MGEPSFLDKNGKWILIGIGGYLVYNAVSKTLDALLVQFGLLKSEQEKKVDDQNQDPNGAFSPKWWTYAPQGARLITVSSARKLADELWDSVGWMNDDFGKAFGIFKQMKSKSQVSFFADQWQQYKHSDLLTWLLGGNIWDYPADRFSADQVAQILTYVDKLPKY